MKKILSILLLLALCLTVAAFAEEAQTVEYTTAEYEAPFFYSKKEKAFEPYKKNANEQQGTIEALEYDCPAYAFNAILGTNETIHKKLYVYLPYGYDAAQQYNVLYLMHGGGDNQEYWLGKDKELTGGRPGFGETTQNVLDNMIAEGLCEPLHPHRANYGGVVGDGTYFKFHAPMEAHFDTLTIGYRCGCGMTKPAD